VNARLLQSLVGASTGPRLELRWSAPTAPLAIDDVEAGGRWGVMPLRAPDEAPTAA